MIQPTPFSPILITLDLFALPADDTDRDTVCRISGGRTETRLRPVTCAPRRQWETMKAEGLEFAPDGMTILRVAGTEDPHYMPPPCISNDTANMKAAMYALPSNCR